MSDKKPKPTDEELMKIIDKAFKEFEGDASVFMSAAGTLLMGKRLGWKGIRVTMAASTFRKYENILGIKFRDVLPDRTKDSTRLRGIRIVDSIGRFWQALSGGFVSATDGKQVEPAT